MAAVSINHNNRRALLVSCFALGFLVLLSTCTSHAAAAAMSTRTRRSSSNQVPPHLEEEEVVEATASAGGYRTFIVLLERPSGAGEMDARAHQAWHESFLPSKLTELGEPRLLRSYRFIVNGFAARLTEAELQQQVTSKPGFVAAFPNGFRHIRTTRTPAFLGLLDSGAGRVSTWKDTDYGSGVIIGLIDSGIDPQHPSMSDIVFPDEVPERWKGSCHQGFRCNRKLIGAKNFVRPNEPPMDDPDGHGTHTASTAAGSFVNDVSVNGGLANGTASGMAPWAHVAIYKACLHGRCPDDAIIHAMDEAVHDGVDVISMSISQPVKTTYDHDVLAIAAYSAMEKGVPVVACAGNQGPGASTVENDAPWMFTVGAGTVDRSLEAKLRFTTGDPILGQSMADRKRIGANPGGWYPVLYREEGGRRYCMYPEAEKQALFQDKIVICEVGGSMPGGGDPFAEAVTKYKAAAAVSIEPSQCGYTFGLHDFGPALPIVQVSYDERDRLKGYASWPAARASLELGDTVLGSSTPAPIVAYFSGRGPSKRSPGILKPDIMAPGVNILAGVPDAHQPFNFMSGTSMATPHVSGLVALFRTLHPHWSPAAIRSAFVTTADVVDNTGKHILDEHRAAGVGAYGTGAGHVNVARALDPGLVYDVNPEMYTGYVCSTLGEAALRRITRDNSRTCSGYLPIRESNLNYPTITVRLKPSPFVLVRILTNVAPLGPPETYTIKVDMPPEVGVTVTPSTLTFTFPGELAGYSLTVSSVGSGPVDGRIYQRHLDINQPHSQDPDDRSCWLGQPLVLHRTEIGLASPACRNPQAGAVHSNTGYPSCTKTEESVKIANISPLNLK